MSIRIWKKREPLVVTRYRMGAGGNRRFLRLAVVTDLHEGDPRRILALLEKEKPDAILVAGDLLERHQEGASEWTMEKMDRWMSRPGMRRNRLMATARMGLCSFMNLLAQKDDSRQGTRNARYFLRRAGRLAPVFYSVGNHEWYFTEGDRKYLTRCGICLLDNADTIWESPAGPVRIGGLSTRYDLEWLDRFAAKPGEKILLCHHPEYYERYIRRTGRDTFGLILSGHAHGGQWRILGRGVFAPGQGMFARRVHGAFRTAGGLQIVSAGAFNSASLPRLFNPCELVMVEVRLPFSFEKDRCR